jgi:hypothetical protein
MTKRTPYGYQHPNAYRKWLEEHDDLLRAVSLKGTSRTALQSVVDAETLGLCLGRSSDSVVLRGVKIGVVIPYRDELTAYLAQAEQEYLKEQHERLAKQFDNPEVAGFLQVLDALSDKETRQ